MTHQLSPDHLKMLIEGSGIALDVIEERGYRTCTGYSELKSLGILVRRDTSTHGLLIPVHTVTGSLAQIFIAKEDQFRQLVVADCNRNWSGLQSAHFQDHINCIYHPAQDHIICN